MGWWWSSNQQQEFAFTALVGGDVLGAGDTNVDIGDSFAMAYSASAHITVTDNDTGLSGDAFYDEEGDDRRGQIADITVDGVLVHEGVKIYAEQVYILYGDDGRLYYIVEIEVADEAGTDVDDYYAFIGDVPPGGTDLTVVGETNVYGEWIKYRDLSAGLDWGLGSDGAVTIEAEDMALSNYRVDDIDAASGGEVIKLKRDEGEASVVFGAEDGVYDLTVAYVDEIDGEGEIEIVVNGAVLATIVLDENDDGWGGDGSSISSFTLAGVALSQGDEIVLRGARDGFELARIDAVTFTQQSNQAPDAVDDALSVNEGAALTADVLDNDSDPDGDAVALVSAGGAAPGVAFTAVTDGGRTVQASVDSAGVLSFAASAGLFNDLALGQSDLLTFAYEITDGQGAFDTATATVTIVGQNDAPTVGGPLAVTAGEDDAGFGLNLLQGAADVDAGATLGIANFAVLDGDASGLTLNGTVLEIDPDAYGALADGESEVVQVAYTVVDEHGAGVQQTATVTIEGANDAPEIENPIVVDATEDDADFVVDLLAGATDAEGDGLQIQNLVLVTGNAAGVTINGATLEVAPDAYNFLPIGQAAEIVYSYDIVDGAGAVAPQTATVTIDGVNDAPVAAGETLTFEEDGDPVGAANVLANESDPDAGDSVFVAMAGGVAVGTPFLVTATSGRSGMATFQADGSVAFDPSGFGDLAAGETDSVTIDYQVTDNHGGVADATVTVVVQGQNAAPAANPLTVTGDEDTVIAGQIAATDPDATDALTYTLLSQAGDGTVSLNADGSFTYAASAPNFNGTDTFRYSVADPFGGEDEGTVTIVVDPVNDDPDAQDLQVDGEPDTALSGQLVATDVDGDTLTYSLGDGPANGSVTVASDGAFDYAPDAGFFGDDVFTFNVDDGNGGADTATVTVSVAAPNLPPDAVDQFFTVAEDSGNNFITVAATDPNDDPLTYAVATQSLDGTVVVIDPQDGEFIFKPKANFFGVTTFNYSVSDGVNAPVVGVATVTVTPVNDAPVANDLNAIGDEDTVISGMLTANDIDGDVLSFSLGAGPTSGDVVIDTDGGFDYTPFADFNGSDSFTFLVEDGAGGSDTATVSITVNPVDEPLGLAGVGGDDDPGIG